MESCQVQISDLDKHQQYEYMLVIVANVRVKILSRQTWVHDMYMLDYICRYLSILTS